MSYMTSNMRILILCGLEGLLEFFDFMIFVLFSNKIAQIFSGSK